MKIWPRLLRHTTRLDYGRIIELSVSQVNGVRPEQDSDAKADT